MKEINEKRISVMLILFFVGLPGFEPRQTESKSVVLPLHHNPIIAQISLGVQK